MVSLSGTRHIWLVLLALLRLVSHGEGGRYWEQFPSPGGIWGVGDIGVDADDGLWVLGSGVLFYWDRAAGKWTKRGPDFSFAKEDKDGNAYGQTEAALFSAGPRLFFLYRKIRKAGGRNLRVAEGPTPIRDGR